MPHPQVTQSSLLLPQALSLFPTLSYREFMDKQDCVSGSIVTSVLLNAETVIEIIMYVTRKRNMVRFNE